MALKTPKQFLARDNYSEKLSDPRWEQRRKEFVNSRERFCQSCRRSDLVLQVHHLAYERGREPWDYQDHELTLLCEPCHAKWHRLINAFKVTVGRMSCSDLQMLVGSLSVLIKEHTAAELSFAFAQLACEKNTMLRLRVSWERGDNWKSQQREAVNP